MTWFYSTKYASFFPRLFAVMFDSLLFGLALPIMLAYLATATDLVDLLTKFVYYITLVYFPLVGVSIAYYVYGLSKFGKTIGKALAGLEVTNAKGEYLSPGMSLFRELIGKPVSGAVFLAGFFAILFTADQRAWHDLLADTYVHFKTKRWWLSALGVVALVALHSWLVYTAVTSFQGNSELIGHIESTFNISLSDLF